MVWIFGGCISAKNPLTGQTLNKEDVSQNKTKIKILTQLQASGKMVVQERCTLRSDQCCVLRSNYYARKGLKQHESTSS